MDSLIDSTSAAEGQSSQVQRQVRLRLASRHADLALPDSTGPILVPTGIAQIFLLPPEL